MPDAITVSCPSCLTSFPVDPAKVPPGGVRARCSECSDIFPVDVPREEQGSAATDLDADLDLDRESGSPGFEAPGEEFAGEAGEDEFGEPGQGEFGEPAVNEADFSDRAGAEPGDLELAGGDLQDADGNDEELDPGLGTGYEAPTAEDDAPGLEIEEPGNAGDGPAEAADSPPDEEPTAGAGPGLDPELESQAEVDYFFGGEGEGGEGEGAGAGLETEPGSDPDAEGGWSDASPATDRGPGGGEAATERPAFGQRSPEEKAERLARVLVSDMITYNPQMYERARAQGTLKEDFEDEIERSWEEYVDQVGEELATSTGYWQEALNDILAEGEKIF